ncbi:MAG: hypothetical protein GY855_05295, partial [candidate division Zixibacteria bacterium]|nr:hypothetical protein [candidate division Zixibacteria bacterium]
MKKTVINSFITTIILMVVISFIPDNSLANSAPQFDPIVSQTILEGNVFNYTVIAEDIDGDPISIVAISRPSGSTFIDNGDGTAEIQWQPEYIGPNSSNSSPFVISFMASDGMASDQIQTDIVVLNNNRKPIIDPINIVEVEAGELASITLTGSDPDQDEVNWNLLSAPSQMSFTSDINAQLDWQTLFADSGSYAISVELADTYGITDTANITLVVLPLAVYTMSIDTISGYSGESVTVGVNLNNLEEVSGFNLLVNYDVSALLFSNLTNVGTRSESFEYFTYQLDNNNINGDILIAGIADIDNSVTTDNLADGDGSLADLTFYITNDLNFSGYAVPVNFVFRNIVDNSDNTLTDILGEAIGQEAINYENGYISIKQIDYSGVGDINLNGVTYEIADAIYLMNFFINPGHFPLNAKQRVNSDVNHDGLMATIADLVYLVNYLVNPNISNKLAPINNPVEIYNYTTTDNFSISSNSDTEIGGLAITLEAERPINIEMTNSLNFGTEGMTIKKSVDGNLLRLLIYGEDGISIPAGINDIIFINNDNKLTIKEIEVSSADGRLMRTEKTEFSNPAVPNGY